ncbi:hypothetical protein ACIQUQ_22970 [Streptomyces sp. NPDC101118]|uniref:hypothetical protein n=1 Tax=Streptomyces sp. NPDC101118 TaxID=3366109 RepID=UPI00382B0C7F
MLDFQLLGAIAGIGGVALGGLFLIYRNFIQNLIRQRLFRTLTALQATVLFGAVITLTFAIAILGIFATLADGRGATKFMVMVGLLLLFLLAAVVVVGRFVAPRPGPAAGADPEERTLARVARLVSQGEPAAAERALEGSGTDRESEEFWYWKARIALAGGNAATALGYVDEALKLEPGNPHATALKIRILLVGQDPADLGRAQALATAAEGRDAGLDVWLRRLRAEGMFRVGVRTNTELDDRFPLPVRQGRPAGR